MQLVTERQKWIELLDASISLSQLFPHSLTNVIGIHWHARNVLVHRPSEHLFLEKLKWRIEKRWNRFKFLYYRPLSLGSHPNSQRALRQGHRLGSHPKHGPHRNILWTCFYDKTPRCWNYVSLWNVYRSNKGISNKHFNWTLTSYTKAYDRIKKGKNAWF